MIKRYSLKEMDKIWSDEEKFNIWLKIEILACEAMKHLGKVTNDAFNKIKKSARFNTDEINEIEKTVKHDVIAFLTSVSRSLGDESRYIHMGLTSSDILDTCLSIQVQKASELLLSAIYGLMNILMEKAFKYKETIMMGRSHGVHAEPITFGLKLALWYDEMRRNKQRLMRAAENLRIGKISGAVGTYAHISTYVEEHVCQKLNLMPDTISTQIIQRDRHAEYIMTLSIIAASLDKFASEIRHLQRTEVLEVEESFTPGQKGSSAMPHKRNPIKSAEGQDFEFPLWIGPYEGLNILEFQKKEISKRPNTYETICTLISSLGASVDKLIINKVEGGIYFGLLNLKVGDRISSIDIRPSDGLNIALRENAPIYILDTVLQKILTNYKPNKENLDNVDPKDFMKGM